MEDRGEGCGLGKLISFPLANIGRATLPEMVSEAPSFELSVAFQQRNVDYFLRQTAILLALGRPKQWTAQARHDRSTIGGESSHKLCAVVTPNLDKLWINESLSIDGEPGWHVFGGALRTMLNSVLQHNMLGFTGLAGSAYVNLITTLVFHQSEEKAWDLGAWALEKPS